MIPLPYLTLIRTIIREKKLCKFHQNILSYNKWLCGIQRLILRTFCFILFFIFLFVFLPRFFFLSSLISLFLILSSVSCRGTGSARLLRMRRVESDSFSFQPARLSQFIRYHPRPSLIFILLALTKLIG